MRMFSGSVGFCFQVSTLRGKRGWFIFELKKESYIEFGVLLMTGFLVVKGAFIPHDINLVS